MDPVYREDAVKPFLGRKRAIPHKCFQGEAAYPGTLASEDKNYYYHATRLENISGILENGLDPGKGGTGGAGQVIATPYDAAKGAYFRRVDRGFICVTPSPEVAVKYAYEYDDRADNGDTLSAAVILRVNKGKFNGYKSCDSFKIFQKLPEEERREAYIINDTLEKDGAFRINQPIATEDLEMLTEEGWVSLRDLALRQEIYQNVKTMVDDVEKGAKENEEEEEREGEEAQRTKVSLEEMREEEGLRKESRTQQVKGNTASMEAETFGLH